MVDILKSLKPEEIGTVLIVLGLVREARSGWIAVEAGIKVLGSLVLFNS